MEMGALQETLQHLLGWLLPAAADLAQWLGAGLTYLRLAAATVLAAAAAGRVGLAAEQGLRLVQEITLALG
jgi:hypothetical protein